MLCVAAFSAVAQQPNVALNADGYRAVKWSTTEGLEFNESNTMIKDATGFMWIGSNGVLCRFDGSEFRKYRPGREKGSFLNCDRIYSFNEDSLHNIWIGTDKGISRYDVRADSFTNNTAAVNPSNYDRSVRTFWSSSNKVYGLEYGRKIVAYDIHTMEKKILVTLSDEEDKGMNGVSLNYTILDTVSNCIWMLEGYKSDSDRNYYRGRLLQISLKDKKRTRFEWECFRKNVSHRHDAEAIVFDPKRNSIWVNSGDGLLEFSLKDKQFHRVEILSELSNSKGYDRGVGIDIDGNGRIWFSTNINGIFIFDPGTGIVQQVFSDPFLQKETGDANLHIYFDRDGIVWTSYWMGKGIYQIIPNRSPIKRYKANPSQKGALSNGLISTIANGPGGKIWIGSADGINVFDPVTEKFDVMREKDLPGIKGSAILPLYIDTIQQKAWLNAGRQETISQYFGMGMYEMDLNTRKCKPIVFRKGSMQIGPFSVKHTLVKPFEGGIIFCIENYGVFQIKKGSLVAEQIISLNAGFFGGMLLADNHYLFLQLGSNLPNFTFENKNGQWTKITRPFDSVYWSFILYNSKDHSYWVGFKDGLEQYDSGFRKIKTYTEEDGIKGMILNIAVDKSGNIWFVTNQQVGRLSPATGVISIVSNTGGHKQQDYDWYVPDGKDALGNIYFGIGWKTGIADSSWGLDRIYPERYSSNSTSSVYVKSLLINQKPFRHYAVLNGNDELSLKYNQNTIRIETGVFDFYSSQQGKIRYKLEINGNQANWQYPTDPIIQYENLSPGSYNFVIQASNAYKEFTSPERILTFDISPPYWQTWWFRSLALAFVITGTYGIAQYRSRNLRKRNADLEEKVLLRTGELKQSLENLKATQRQLIQSEKMASLGELTSGIAHEIQNPLNFINNFSELSNELIDEMEIELSKGDIKEASAIAESIQQNLSKINHHGKRADAIVKSMLQHSRSSSGQKESTNLNALCHEYFHLAYHGWRAKDKSFNATIETLLDDSIGNVSVIPQEFGRVILNLINNAFYAVDEKLKKQTEAYRPKVTLSTKKMGNKVEIIVADNGNGIPQNVVDKIFQPFFTTKPTGEGTGLGLSLSYDIISAHGGELQVDTREGEGTKFIISMPV